VAISVADNPSKPIFYGWWIVVTAFLNLFFIVGIIFYGFPLFYPSFVESLGFTRAQITQGFFLGFLIIGLPLGFLAGALIDRIGAQFVILSGIGLVAASLFLMGSMTRFWQYELLCVMEVLGYVLAGPLANQVLIARWFRERRGQAMGYAYLGLGLGGVAAPLLITALTRTIGWRHALESVGALIGIVLVPVGIWVTRSSPEEMGLHSDGVADSESKSEKSQAAAPSSAVVSQAVHSANFWLILVGSTLVIGAIGAVIQHFILFLTDVGYTPTAASRFSTALLSSSLGGRVLVGYVADRRRKSSIMALFYLLIGASVFLLAWPHSPAVLWTFAIVFGFSMGADYMLIPLVTAECFGTASLGKLLALIIMGYTLGQWGAPWMAGRIFDARHSYDLAWKFMAIAGVVGAAAIYAVSALSRRKQA